METGSPRSRHRALLPGGAWPLALLLLATLWVYRPYCGSRLVVGNDDGDALTYHSVVADSLAQRRAGVFPAYVGQSAYRWNGGTYPQAQAPGLTLLAAGLDAATLDRLSPAAMLNLIVLVSALGGALFMYLAACRLTHGRPWVSAVAALAYVSCPGVLGSLVRLDMYTTFLVLPLLPLLWGALFGLLFADGSRFRQAVLLGLVTAALWSCHPPVALWATSAAALAGLTATAPTRLPWRALMLAAGVFVVAESWHLTTVFSLGAQHVRDSGLGSAPFRPLSPTFVDAVLANEGAELPGALLPVGWALGGRVNGWPGVADEAGFLPPSWRQRVGTPYLQLGYALWAALAVGLASVFEARDRRSLAPVAGALVLVAFLFPWPLLGELLWSHLPSFYGITRPWPMQRLYVLLASLAPFCALPRLARLRPAVLAPALALAAGWTLHEAEQFGRLGLERRREPAATLSENARLKRKDLQMGAARLLPEFGDPALHLRLLSADGRQVLADNAMALEQRAAIERPDTRAPRADLVLSPRLRQAVFFRPEPGFRLAAAASGYWRQADVPPLALWTSERQDKVVALLRAGSPSETPTARVAFAAVPYQPASLPLGLIGSIPLQVRLSEAHPAGLLETPRLYLPGYEATADGRKVAVSASPEGYLRVSLPAGAREARLDYRGTPGMRTTFWLSSFGWLLGLAFMARSGGTG